MAGTTVLRDRNGSPTSGPASASGSWVGLSELTISEEFQCRETISTAVVQEYRELLDSSEQPWPFESPCEVYAVGAHRILVDGFHRVAAIKAAGEDQIFARIIKGTRTEALRAALRANRTHGLRRSNRDKRRTVMMALADKTIAKWSDRQIADECGVSHNFVSTVRGELSSDDSSPPVSTGRDGKQRPASKDAAHTQRARIAEKIESRPDASDREIAKSLGCDHKTVAAVRAASADAPACQAVGTPDSDPPDAMPDNAPEHRDILDMFEDMKQLIRDAMHEFPQAQRAIAWKQLVEQLGAEDMQQW